MAVDPNWYSRGRDGAGFLLRELIDMFDDDDEDPITPDSIAICPSDKPPNADTDKDSDMSDEEAMDNVDHLPAPYVPKWQCGIHNKTRKVTSILLSRTTTFPSGSAVYTTKQGK
ncbi:hypothetical protein QE152_g28422 [Popillia japonica]|uniref:Uncharacterized protein n=1 Tax=Popillia japonica TaxID=7064 RepID=A0AAW1JLR2_POPJA